ncbi:(2Fe-2S)-binding protein [Streptomyces durmitorensis]|uniref:(2Fe-2S)-binding protein n=1 Tax=Streptomyces durmitorensis TaxID=319947 RepID=A0ABY4PNP0_9ACTN|nr:IucA/IucC family C-terminal-domain containing protein [Streptomyces durmitorensis]UQT54666.1 (2Fe-2S)-binding protein [Streptomyces durmitorensis]
MKAPLDLTALGSVGGFFALRAGAPPSGVQVASLARVYAGDDGPLAFRVDKVAARLGAPDTRVAVSVAQLGLAARLWSVTLGSAALHGEVPDLDPELLHWDADGTSPDDLWLRELTTRPADAASIRDVVQHGHLAPLADALRARYRISAALLWGNAGSALAGAARELDTWARRNGRTDVGERARALAAELFDHPDLRSTGTLRGTAFRRRSCCLYYRCPDGGVCGDCCFDRPPQRSVRGSSPPGASG